MRRRGAVVTGDTAQTIARGLSFRFADLRSLFHLAAQSSSTGAAAPKDIYKLVNNYRTHAGVLKLANVAVELIEHHFPSAIDKLEHDRGLFEGPRPQIIGGSRFEDLCLLLLGSNPASAEIEFGAQQVIIVRTEASKQRLPEDLKRAGLVCTAMESKGLEFDDVLLWNFFSDSEAEAEWRTVTKYWQDQREDPAAEVPYEVTKSNRPSHTRSHSCVTTTDPTSHPRSCATGYRKRCATGYQRC